MSVSELEAHVRVSASGARREQLVIGGGAARVGRRVGRVRLALVYRRGRRADGGGALRRGDGGRCRARRRRSTDARAAARRRAAGRSGQRAVRRLRGLRVRRD